jgi:hypothetical protein
MNTAILDKVVRVVAFALPAFSLLFLVHGLHMVNAGDPGGSGPPNLHMLSQGDPGGSGPPNLHMVSSGDPGGSGPPN